MTPVSIRRNACPRPKPGLPSSVAIVAGALSLVPFSVMCRAASTWTQEGFAEFSRGSAVDAGSNLYVSASGRIQIINRWDLNNDGFLDVIVPSGHAHTEKENTYLYLNNQGDIDGRSRVEIPGGGSAGGFATDLNRDGMTDLVVVNSADSHVKEVSTWIYWGNPGGVLRIPQDGTPRVQRQDCSRRRLRRRYVARSGNRM